MIEKILPPAVVSAETRVDDPYQQVFPEETAIVARAVDKRRCEFGSARACARTALAELGVEPVAIPVGERGAPEWPPGIVGSITHCDGYRGAAVAHSRDMLTIGIDAEPHELLPSGVLETVSLPAERVMLRELAAAAPGTCWDRLLFCAKESVYKAWFPLARCWLGFQDARITICPTEGAFSADLLIPASAGDGVPSGFTGRWLVRDGLIVTAIAVPTHESQV
jgi:4'-phosphopantetheinyl transferase EntD